MAPADYRSTGCDAGPAEDARRGRAQRLFRALRLQRLPRRRRTVRARRSTGLYGKPVPLQDGTRRDRRRTLHPRFDPAAAARRSPPATQPLMPSFAGKVGEDELIRLIAYIKSLGDGREAAP